VSGTRAYRGVSADDRREQRRALLVEGALDCLHADGLAGVSVRSVCARSRLTPRYFYESFEDLDQLLLATLDAVSDEVAASALAALDAAPPRLADQVRAAIDAGYRVVVSDRRKATVLLVAASGSGVLRERRQAIITRFVDLVIDRLPVLTSFGLAERRRARATALFLMGGATEVIEAVLSGRLRLSRAALVDQLTETWLAVLTGTDRSARG
jgi:AcrR family transcriptional regulator